MPRRRPLRCWWGDVHVADLEAKKPWDLRCRYTAEALERWDVGTPLLSCSLPVGTRPLPAAAFLTGLLPEGRHLQFVASQAKVTTDDVYGLLSSYGRDIAGALVITDADDGPGSVTGTVEAYVDDALDAEVAGLEENPLGLHPDTELSIAGIQNKLLLVELPGGRWGRPVHGAPSTHILKVDDDRYPGLVRAEAQCSALAHAVGLAATPPRLDQLAGRDCLIVTRYDRHLVGGEVIRSHQEDACQALGIDIHAHQGRGKYEAYGGPTLAQIAELLRLHARSPRRELDRLVRLVAYTVAIGNADLHGKNVSLLHDDDGRISLAPAYDTVPTMLWPRLRATSAVSIDGATGLATTSAGSIAAEAARWGVAADHARSVVAETVDAIQGALDATVEDDELATRIAERAAGMLS